MIMIEIKTNNNHLEGEISISKDHQQID